MSTRPKKFPSRDAIEAALIEFLEEQEGHSIQITQHDWNIYDELAARSAWRGTRQALTHQWG